jgi:putative sigma-54 modulation protein
MIEKMEIAGIHLDVEPKLKKYVTKKMGAMDKYIPRHARESAHLEVKLKEQKAKDKNQFTCEVILFLPHDTIRIAETTLNIYAAVDIVETKLKNQIRKYKETHTQKRIPGKIAAKIRSRKSA